MESRPSQGRYQLMFTRWTYQVDLNSHPPPGTSRTTVGTVVGTDTHPSREEHQRCTRAYPPDRYLTIIAYPCANRAAKDPPSPSPVAHARVCGSAPSRDACRGRAAPQLSRAAHHYRDSLAGLSCAPTVSPRPARPAALGSLSDPQLSHPSSDGGLRTGAHRRGRRAGDLSAASAPSPPDARTMRCSETCDRASRRRILTLSYAATSFCLKSA